MRFEDIMRLPFSSANPKPICDFMRDEINKLVREGKGGDQHLLNLWYLVRFNVPDHEIEAEDLLDLVIGKDCTPGLFGSTRDQKPSCKATAERSKRASEASSCYLYGDA